MASTAGKRPGDVSKSDGDLNLEDAEDYDLRLLELGYNRFDLGDDVERIRQKQRDLDKPLIVMVVGMGNVGKSTLMNALTGTETAPVGRKPLTWKVDIFENVDLAETGANVYRVSNDGAPEILRD